MKTILLMLLSIVLSLGVSAQRKGDPDGHNGNSEERNEYHSRGYHLYYGLGYNYYPYYGYSYFGYPYYGYPYYGYRFWNRTSHNGNKSIQYRLSLQIKAIKMDYKNKIKQVRHDKSVSHWQKKQKIFSLKTERNQRIVNAEKGFLNQLNTGNQNPGMKNNQKPGRENTTSSMIQHNQ
jgi:hypothetical protein